MKMKFFSLNKMFYNEYRVLKDHIKGEWTHERYAEKTCRSKFYD